jgi:hypothetical protein
MKLSDILAEMPTDLNKDAPFAFNIDGSYISDNQLSRDFQFLGELTIDSMPYKFWLSKRMNRALVTTIPSNATLDTLDGNGNVKNLIACDAHFKDQNLIDLPNSVQIDTVSTNTRHMGRNLAMILYIVIARYGHPVISDFDQYNGGVGLWKTLSIQSGNRRFVVRVWNIRNSDWLRDDDEGIISFDMSNIPTEQVWNNIGQQTETLLVLSSK